MMKLVAFSDTHLQHNKIKHMPDGDVLIFAGDSSAAGYDKKELEDFIEWYSKFTHQYKIYVPGNHERFLDDEHMIKQGYEPIANECIKLIKDAGIIYLNDSSVDIKGINFYGSGVSPAFCDWSFNRERGGDIKKHWDLIYKTDILITHSPPHNILDQAPNGFRAGCEDLLEAVKRVKPRVHLFGHLHLMEGMAKRHEEDGIIFLNVAILDDYYKMKFKPVAFEV